MSTNPTKVITSKDVVFSYLNVLQPRAAVEGATPKYSVSLIIKKTDKFTIDRINAAIRAAYEEGLSRLKGNSKTAPTLESLRKILRDGDEEKPNDEAYKGCLFLNASTATRPGLVDIDCNEIIDPNMIYSGVIGRASINFYAYNTGMSKGIACGLNNLQIIKDGKRLGGRASAQSDFGQNSSSDEDFLG